MLQIVLHLWGICSCPVLQNGCRRRVEYAFPQTQGNEARFNTIRCPYYETCKRYGCTRIVRAFCAGDDAGCGHLHPDLFWGRTKTIGRGADCCDFVPAYRKNKDGKRG